MSNAASMLKDFAGTDAVLATIPENPSLQSSTKTGVPADEAFGRGVAMA